MIDASMRDLHNEYISIKRPNSKTKIYSRRTHIKEINAENFIEYGRNFEVLTPYSIQLKYIQGNVF